MPKLNDEQFKELLEQIKLNSIPLSLNVSKENKEQALKECNEYIKTGNKNINDMTPLTIYYIISKLSEEKQIIFFKENIIAPQQQNGMQIDPFILHFIQKTPDPFFFQARFPGRCPSNHKIYVLSISHIFFIIPHFIFPGQ